MVSLLFVTGFMGSGKTTVGRRIAQTLGWKFVDLDDAVVEMAGRSIPVIFEADGESGFRGLEHQALRGTDRAETAGTRPGGRVGWGCSDQCADRERCIG